ncbi:PrpF domain-containing protein [Streptomyces sp. NPDC056061]|uniref:PrpF domain-containing protein n=1 Tax=Streptomyces sp. NPDC056061 TaxID=3345700 RepID=UPI0035E25A92
MIGHLAHATGSPCPTCVLDAQRLPDDEPRLLQHLAEIRRYLDAAGGSHVLKLALVKPSPHPMFDLDYRFVQALPDAPDHFELRGSCGHSILAAVTAAARAGMLPRLTARTRVRVRVLNNGDSVVLEAVRVEDGRATFTVQFVQPRPVPFADLLMTGETVTRLDIGGQRVPVSLVSSGNAYAFVDARALGIDAAAPLFDSDGGLLDRLRRIRDAAAHRLGRAPGGAFPKVAAILPDDRAAIAARAVSVPDWHPTIALTGAVCLGTAVRIPHTIPWHIARESGATDGPVDIRTPGGRTTVTSVTCGSGTDGALMWATVADKHVSFQGSFVIDPLRHLQFEEVAQCLALSTAA